MIAKKYKDIYDKFVCHYKNVHVNPWHEIGEGQLGNLYNELINSMDIDNDYNFTYFMNFVIKRLSGAEDAHTKYDHVSLLPMNFRIFDSEVLVNYPEALKGCKLVSINGIDINSIIKELDDVITYGTDGKRKYELEKSLFNRYILFGLPSLRNSDELFFEIEKNNSEKVIKRFNKSEKYLDELFDYNRYKYGNNAKYKFIDNCLVYNHSSVQPGFKKYIDNAINNLRKEDLANIDTIIIDIRGNTGGNSALNKILMDFLRENSDKKLICLTDYRVFSGGRYALRDLINLGAITIGEEISTPINCYGNSNWINIDENYFSVSECYFHPFLGWSVSSKEEFQEEITSDILIPCIFKPDILVETNKEDYIKGVDTILNYALDYAHQNKRMK
jgi:hypothetical protein